ncbi:uncharacterized protein LOC116416911 [Nasonia vitripennis]|nr:uncharacterized protein LOC116416911 [Nasonia vitripennis]
MRKDVFYKPAIREICTFPLSVLHWTIEAIDFSKDLGKDILYMFSLIGTFCKPFMAPDGHVSKPINLYALGTVVSNTFVPLCQLSTEDYSTSLFNKFFGENIRSGLAIPKFLVLDYYTHHYLTANEVFNEYLPYEEYLLLCYDYLTGKAQILPRVIIYTHNRFLIIKIKYWECINRIQLPSVKRFHLYCVIVLSLQQNLDDFQRNLKSIFIVSSSQYQSKITHENFELIKLQIQELNVETLYSNEELEKIENKFKQIVDLDNVIKINCDKCKCIKDFIENIFIEANQIMITQNDQSCENNVFYNPQFCEELMKLCMEFVLWSNIIQQNSITSSSCDFTALLDSYKVDFDRYLSLKFESTPRLNEYLLKNIDYENEKLEYLRKIIHSEASRKTKDKYFDYSYMQYEENWMGLNNYRVKAKEENNSENSSSSDDESILDTNNDSDGVDFEEVSLNINTFIDSVCQDNNDNHISHTHAVISEKLVPIENENTKVESQYVHDKHDNEIFQQNAVTKQNNNTSKSNKKVQKSESAIAKNNFNRGKFLRPCEDIYLLQQKPTQSSIKRQVIKNSNQSTSNKINKQRRILATSSPFDSLLEILTSAYCNIQKFQNFITQPTNYTIEEITEEFFNILQKYVENFNFRQLSSLRVKFVDKLCGSASQKFCWRQSIGEFYKRIMPSTIIDKYECNQCNIISYRHEKCINMSSTEIMSENYIENIIKHLHIPDKCDKCGHKIFIADFKIQNILCIDIEDTVKNSGSCLLKLGELVSHIKIEEQSFILMGIIGFQEPLGEQTTRHYFACCRGIQGFWLKYDNTEESSKPIRISDKAASLNGAILIYIEFDNKV